MKVIGIIAAMEQEYKEIQKVMTEIQKEEIAGLRFTKGKINDKSCVLVRSGVGKVHAGRTTQVLIDNFDVEYIINAGTSGAISSLLEIGDVIIGKHVVQHDFDITAFDHSKGYIPGVGDRVACDRNLIDEFENTIIHSNEKTYKTKLGVVATGDIFVTESAMKDKIRAKFDADVVDMECGAIAQVAYLNRVPFMVIRVISDIPNGKNSLAFQSNLQLATRRCAIILKEFL